jgi:hypothetical protein
MKSLMPGPSRSLRTRVSRPRFSGESEGASPLYVCEQGFVEAPRVLASQPKAQLRLMSRPAQVLLLGPGWRFLRQRRSVVCV